MTNKDKKITEDLFCNLVSDNRQKEIMKMIIEGMPEEEILENLIKSSKKR